MGLIAAIAILSFIMILLLTVSIVDSSQRMKYLKGQISVRKTKLKITLQTIFAIVIALTAQISVALLLS